MKAGDTIFVPGGWWHTVLNVEDTIAVTQVWQLATATPLQHHGNTTATPQLAPARLGDSISSAVCLSPLRASVFPFALSFSHPPSLLSPLSPSSLPPYRIHSHAISVRFRPSCSPC